MTIAMSSYFESFSLRHGRVAFDQLKGAPRGDVTSDEASPVRLSRYLPLVVFTTASVVVAPGVLMGVLVPRGSTLLMVALSTASAVAVSIAIASAEAALWTRRSGSRDLVFADLMLWGWLRRCWTERRLAKVQALYDSARKAGLTVSIELLTELSKRLEARDVYTLGHSRRVARHAEGIARAMHLSPAEIAKIRTAATVHDVGKIYTPREILNNPGRLTDREYAIVKLHASDGAEMLAGVGDPEIAAMVRHHHERVDGNGYPDGLAGSDIPLGARIIAVADTFDAITSNRAYRPGGTHKRALEVLSRQAGSQLDGPAVATFLSRYSARRSVAWFAFAAVVPQRIFAALQTATPGIGAGAGTIPSMLPALGAAGVLAVSSGLLHGRAERNSPRQPATVHHHQRVAAGAPTANAGRHGGPAASTRPTQPQHLRVHGSARIRVRTPLSTSVPDSQKAGTGGPVAAAPTVPPAVSPTPPKSPTSPPPSTPPASPPTSSTPAPTTPVPTPPVPTTPVPTPPAPSPAPAPTLPAPLGGEIPKLPSLPIGQLPAKLTDARARAKISDLR
jgi:putative nucleotidyltransferase with HDIG domain